MHTICPTSTTKRTWRQIQDRNILEEGSFTTHQDQGSRHRKEYTSGWRGYGHWAMWKRGVIVLVEPAWTSLEIKKCFSVQHYKAHWNITVYNPTLLLKSGISYFSISLIVSKISLCENAATIELLSSRFLTYSSWDLGMLWNPISHHKD